MNLLNDTSIVRQMFESNVQEIKPAQHQLTIDEFLGWSGHQTGKYALASKSDNIYDASDRRDHCGHHFSSSSSGPGDPSHSWNGAFRLLLLSLISTGGSMGGIFVISAITVIDTFQVRGNVYIVSIAFSHLMVTVLVLPATCIGIMAGVPNDPSICHLQWLITVACLMISVLSFMFMATENFLGLGSLVTYDLCCTKFRIVLLVLIVWMWGIAFALTQHFYNFGPSFCAHEVNNAIWYEYHGSVLGAGILLPTLITVYYFARCAFRMKALRVRFENNPSEDPWAYILTDENLLQSNIIVYVVSLLMWAPFCVICAISPFKHVNQEVLDAAWWLALSNSCGYSFLYAFSNKDFGEAFFKLFYYCCCKSHVTFTRKGAGIRRGIANDAVGLRVHIIPGLNIYNQRRDVPPARGGHHVFGGHVGAATVNYNFGGGGGGGGGGIGGGSSGGGLGGGGIGFRGGPFTKSFQTKGVSAKSSSQL